MAKPHFWKKHQGYSSQKNKEMELNWDVHLYVLKLKWKIESHSVFGFPDNYIIIYMYIVYIYFYSYPLP